MAPFALILAGGRGERLWPLSRDRAPKQFMRVGEKTLLEATLDRIRPVVAPERTWIVTRAVLAETVQRLAPGYPVLAEPEGKNTAPAIALGCHVALQEGGPDAILVVLPADHVIEPLESFVRAVQTAMETAKQGFLVTFGIPPTRPETGYGYIEAGAPLTPQTEDIPVYRVRAFHEKPDRATAESYLHRGTFYWNSGMFVFPAQVLLEEFRRYQPEIASALEDLDVQDPERLRSFYQRVPEISIDYAIMEKSDRIAMVRAPFQWEDVGSLAALEAVLPRVGANAVQGKAVTLEAQDNVLVAEGDGLIAVYGVQDLVVVHTPDVTLVVPKKDAQRVKDLLKVLKAQPGTERYWRDKPTKH